MTTPKQAEADRFDADLYRLIVRAEREKAAKWQEIGRILRQARPLVRSFMSRDDRAVTGG